MTGKALDELDEMRTAPIAVTRHPHHLPRRPGDRECGAAGKTAIGIAADRVRRTGKRRRLAGEKLPGRRRRLRMLQWRQQLGSERARRRRIDQMFFLRAGRTGGEDKNSEQASDSAHQRLLFVATVALWAAFLPRSLLVRSLLARSLARYETARARRRYAAASRSLSPVTKRSPAAGSTSSISRRSVVACASIAPSGKMWPIVTPRAASARATKRQRWHSSGSRSEHIRQRRWRTASARTRSIPAWKLGAFAMAS